MDQALLAAIRQGKALKKSETNDRSAPVAGRVVDGSEPPKPKATAAPAAPKPGAPAPGSAAAMLFGAGGIPKLKPTGASQPASTPAAPTGPPAARGGAPPPPPPPPSGPAAARGGPPPPPPPASVGSGPPATRGGPPPPPPPPPTTTVDAKPPAPPTPPVGKPAPPVPQGSKPPPPPPPVSKPPPPVPSARASVKPAGPVVVPQSAGSGVSALGALFLLIHVVNGCWLFTAVSYTL